MKRWTGFSSQTLSCKRGIQKCGRCRNFAWRLLLCLLLLLLRTLVLSRCAWITNLIIEALSIHRRHYRLLSLYLSHPPLKCSKCTGQTPRIYTCAYAHTKHDDDNNDRQMVFLFFFLLLCFLFRLKIWLHWWNPCLGVFESRNREEILSIVNHRLFQSSKLWEEGRKRQTDKARQGKARQGRADGSSLPLAYRSTETCVLREPFPYRPTKWARKWQSRQGTEWKGKGENKNNQQSKPPMMYPPTATSYPSLPFPSWPEDDGFRRIFWPSARTNEASSS